MLRKWLDQFWIYNQYKYPAVWLLDYIMNLFSVILVFANSLLSELFFLWWLLEAILITFVTADHFWAKLYDKAECYGLEVELSQTQMKSKLCSLVKIWPNSSCGQAKKTCKKQWVILLTVLVKLIRFNVVA